MAFLELFSKRGKAPKTLGHDIPTKVRKRLLMLLSRLRDGAGSFVFDQIQRRLIDRYGEITPCPEPSWDGPSIHPVVYHFLRCGDEEALDFIEAVFTSTRDVAGAIELVEEMNRVFREEGIAFELTPMTQRTIKGGGKMFGRTVDSFEVDFPIIRDRGNSVQEENMKECLGLLTDSVFKIANDQFLKAHRHYRANEWDQTIAYCGSAFESALKAVLQKKGVAFKENATAQALIVESVKAGIFPQTYENSLIGIANVRNAMSDTTHGRTPATQIIPDQKNAEHLLYVTAANIVFISKCI